MNEIEAVVARAVALANDTVQGACEPYQGAKALWRMEIDLHALADALTVFAGLASEWEDKPHQRTGYEKDIVVQADRFLSTFGK